MENTNTQKEKGSKIKYSGKIKEYIRQKGPSNLSELGKIGISRQTLHYNLRNLCINKEIRACIKIESKAGFVIPLCDEVFFTITSQYDNPQAVLDVINQMCDYNDPMSEQAKTDFIELYVDRAKSTLDALKKIQANRTDEKFEEEWTRLKRNDKQNARRHAIELVHILMSRVSNDLKEKVAFALTYKDDDGIYDLNGLYYKEIYHLSNRY